MYYMYVYYMRISVPIFNSVHIVRTYIHMYVCMYVRTYVYSKWTLIHYSILLYVHTWDILYICTGVRMCNQIGILHCDFKNICTYIRMCNRILCTYVCIF